MIIKPFEAWRDDKLRALTAVDPEEADAQKDVEVGCPACGGDGEVECPCHCPRCEGLVPCERCDGDGRVAVVDLERSDLESKALFSRQAYREELVSELAALARYTGQPLLEPFIEAGFSPHRAIRIKDDGEITKGRLLLIDPASSRTFEPPQEARLH